MSGTRDASAVLSLAVGEVVEIRRILFDTIRDLCTDLGMSEGDIVRCRADTASRLLIETPAGRTVVLERDLARFIQVSTVEIEGSLDAFGEHDAEIQEPPGRRRRQTPSPGPVLLAEHHIKALLPAPVELAETAVLESVGVILLVLDPQKLERDVGLPLRT